MFRVHAESVYWDGLWPSVISAAISAAVAVLAAWLVVRWTQRADRRAARLIESQRAAEMLMRRLREWLPEMLGYPGSSAFTMWQNEVAIQGAVLVEPAFDGRHSSFAGVVRARQDFLGTHMDESHRLVSGTDPKVDASTRLAVKQAASVLEASYAAHRRGEPLPPD